MAPLQKVVVATLDGRARVWSLSTPPPPPHGEPGEEEEPLVTLPPPTQDEPEPVYPGEPKNMLVAVDSSCSFVALANNDVVRVWSIEKRDPRLLHELRTDGEIAMNNVLRSVTFVGASLQLVYGARSVAMGTTGPVVAMAMIAAKVGGCVAVVYPSLSCVRRKRYVVGRAVALALARHTNQVFGDVPTVRPARPWARQPREGGGTVVKLIVAFVLG